MSLAQQVGGTHYSAPKGQGHWDLMERYDIDYLAAQATRYVLRYDRKGRPKEDLEKASSFLHKMLENMRGTRRLVPWAELEAFYAANELDGFKARVLNLILGAGAEEDIMTAALVIANKVIQLT